MYLVKLEFSLDICPGMGLLDHTVTLRVSSFFFFLAVPMAWVSSWARDQTHAVGVTRATAMTLLDPWPTEPLGNSYF